MKDVTYECVVENGCVRLPTEAHIPEKSTVYLVVSHPDERRTIHIYSPRLSDPSKADFFKLVVTEEGTDAPI
jgi:hypothetical protein